MSKEGNSAIVSSLKIAFESYKKAENNRKILSDYHAQLEKLKSNDKALQEKQRALSWIVDDSKFLSVNIDAITAANNTNTQADTRVDFSRSPSAKEMIKRLEKVSDEQAEKAAKDYLKVLISLQNIVEPHKKNFKLTEADFEGTGINYQELKNVISNVAEDVASAIKYTEKFIGEEKKIVANPDKLTRSPSQAMQERINIFNKEDIKIAPSRPQSNAIESASDKSPSIKETRGNFEQKRTPIQPSPTCFTARINNNNSSVSALKNKYDIKSNNARDKQQSPSKLAENKVYIKPTTTASTTAHSDDKDNKSCVSNLIARFNIGGKDGVRK